MDMLLLIVPRCDQIRFGLTYMFCVILKHHSLDLEAEVIHTVTVLFIILHRRGHKDNCTYPQFQYDTIRYEHPCSR